MRSKSRDLEKIENLLERGADPNELVMWGRNALHQAMWDQNLPTLRLLVRYGADVNTPTLDNDTAVMMLSNRKNQIKVLKFLVKNGANLNAVNKWGKTALDNMIIDNNIEAVRELLKLGTNVGASTSSLITAAQEGTLDAAEMLLAFGADPLAKNKSGDNALETSMAFEKPEMFKLLLTKVSKQRKKNKLKSHIFTALRLENDEWLELLLKHGGGPNVIYKDEMSHYSALMAATQNDNVRNVDLLLDYGADSEFKNRDKDTVFDWALYNKSIAVLETLVKRTNGKQHGDLIVKAARLGKLDAVKMFVREGTDVNFKTPHNLTALIIAAADGNVELVEFLIAKSADPNVVNISLYPNGLPPGTKDPVGIPVTSLYSGSALFYAALQGHLEIVKILVKTNVDLDATFDKFKETALMAAAKGGKEDVIRVLVTAGAKVNIKNSKEQSAADIAKYFGRESTVDLLTRLSIK